MNYRILSSVLLVVALLFTGNALCNDKLVVNNAADIAKFKVLIDDVTDDVRVGIGTSTPEGILQVGATTPPVISDPWDVYVYGPKKGRLAIDSAWGNSGIEFIEKGVRKWFIGTFGGTVGFFNQTTKVFNLSLAPSGNVGIGTQAPTKAFHVKSDAIRIEQPRTISSSSTTCGAGEISWDADYVYVCVGTDQWRRATLDTW